MKTSLLCALPVSLVLAAPAFAQPMTPAAYVAAAGASDLFERESATTVLATTTDPHIRSFATMMLSAHSESTAEVKAAAMKSGLKPMPPKLMPAQVKMIAQLNAESGAARDATYIAQQKAAHNQALAVQQAYAMDGTMPALKMAAAKIVPVVKQHITMLMAM